MNDPELKQANTRFALRLGGVVVAMFAFAYALVPLYNIFCDVTGLNGKTGRIQAAEVNATEAQERLVTVEFLANINTGLAWEFKPTVTRMQVHPGELVETYYFARNKSETASTGQAVPSVAPARASRYFSKVQCFCFTEQQLAAGEQRDMLVKFVVDPKLPETVTTVTLSYTFFEKKPNAVERS